MSEGSVKTLTSGSSAQLRGDSDLLRWSDLPTDRDTVVTIKEVHYLKNVPVEGGRLLSKGALSFVGGKKRMPVNATNRRTLNKLFTDEISLWPGKRISLYVDRSVRNPQPGEPPGGIKIRNKEADELKNKAAALSGGEAKEPAAEESRGEYEAPECDSSLCGRFCGDPGQDEPSQCLLAADHEGDCVPEGGEKWGLTS